MAKIELIPDSFWGLFRSKNRMFYMDALMSLYREYEYNNYFISWEVCIQIFDNYFAEKMIKLEDEEQELELEKTQPPATRTLNWLIRSGWLEKQEDYGMGITNVVIPDYASVFLDAFERLYREEGEETDIYIRNVYATIFSYRNDMREDKSLLKSALLNTKILNKSLQNMLHNMNHFFSSLLKQEAYAGLLEEHLNGYVEEVVKKKYRILKTSDNFYQYKNDIKRWLQAIMDNCLRNLQNYNDLNENSEKIEKLTEEYHLAEEISRGFDDIERRIYYIDKEHGKYIRATVTRIHYLLNEDKDTKGRLIQFLNAIASLGEEKRKEAIQRAGELMHFGGLELFSSDRFFKKRRSKADFSSQLEPDEKQEELSKEDILKLNQMHNKYSRIQVESYVEQNMEHGKFEVKKENIRNEEEFEKLILAYSDALRNDSKYQVTVRKDEFVENEKYRCPKLVFEKK